MIGAYFNASLFQHLMRQNINKSCTNNKLMQIETDLIN
jgi:hypothetical protein